MASPVLSQSEFYRGLEAHEIVLAFQPVRSLEPDLRLLRLESLTRWHHPKYGRIPASKMLKEAGRTGMLGPLAKWCVRGALDHLSEWQKVRGDLDLGVSVNLFASQLEAPGFSDLVCDELKQRGIEGRHLTVELNGDESINNYKALRALKDLRDQGVRIAADNFGGSEYSSDNLLQSQVYRLVIDEVKIDRTLVTAANWSRIRGIASRAFFSRMGVVVQGIKTDEQLAAVRALRIDVGQGFNDRLGAPLPRAQTLRLVRSEPAVGLESSGADVGL